MNKKIKSLQEWLPFENVLENGIIKLKTKEYVEILKISPINFNLKSNLEKEAILNSYKIFLKTCNFDIQILIQSNKEDLSSHILKIQKNNLEENVYSKKYINYIQEINQKRKSSSKNYFILIKEIPENKKEKNIQEKEQIYFENLNEKYLKIKECLARCGNIVAKIETREEDEKILNSFLNFRKESNIV